MIRMDLYFFLVGVWSLRQMCLLLNGEQVVVSKPLFYRAHRLFDRAVVHESDEESSEDMQKQNGRKARNSDRVSALTSGDLGELGLVFSHIVLSTLYTRAEQSDLILS